MPSARYIHIIIAHINVNGIIPVRASQAVCKLQEAPGETDGGTSYQPCSPARRVQWILDWLAADTDKHVRLYVAYGIGLGIFQSNERNLHIDQRFRRISLFSVTIWESSSSVIFSSFLPCSKVIP